MSIKSRRFGLDLPPEPGRYHLLVSRTCPWSRRAAIVWEILGLDRHISVAWATGRGPDGFTFADPITGVATVRELYRRDPDFETGDATTVPVLVDLATNQIVVTESGDLMLDAATAWAPFHREGSPDLFPEDLRDDVAAADAWIASNLSRFTHGAVSGDANAEAAFQAGLTGLAERLRDGYLVAEQLTLSDISAFTPVQSWLWAGKEVPGAIQTWVASIAKFGGAARLDPPGW